MKAISTYKLNRRQVLAATAVAIPAIGLLADALAPLNAAQSPPRRAENLYDFFDETEAGIIEAACERLIPADSSGPGARDLGVPSYLDWHLADAWGNGARLYRLGQWQPGTPSEKLQPFTPAELFRSALAAVHCDLSKQGASFAELPASAQDLYLASLQAGLSLPGVDTAAFFELLLRMTTEGYFATNSAGASRRDRLAWPLRGFAGAHASVSLTV